MATTADLENYVPTAEERQQQADLARRDAETEILPLSDLETAVMRMEKALVLSMPKDLSTEDGRRMIHNLVRLIRKTPQLGQCLPATILGGMLTSAQMGLELGVDPLGESYLIPMWNKKAKWQDQNGRDREGAMEATLVVGYKGWQKLAWNTGTITKMTRHVVHENDYYDVEYGLDEDLKHKPARGDRGPVIAYYATIKNVFGEKQFFEMSREEAEAWRDAYAMAKNRKTGYISGPWRDNFDAMALKTCVKGVLKDAPKSAENRTLQLAMHIDGTARLDTSSAHAELEQVHHRVDVDEAEEAPMDIDAALADIGNPEQTEPAAEAETEEERAARRARYIEEGVAAITAYCGRIGEDPLVTAVSVTGENRPTLEDYSPQELDAIWRALQATPVDDTTSTQTD